MIHETRIPSFLAPGNVPAAAAPPAPAQVVEAPADTFVAASAPPTAAPASASAASPVSTPRDQASDAVAGSLLGPLGASIAQLLGGAREAVTPAAQDVDGRIQELESQLRALSEREAQADAHAFDAVEKEREAGEQSIAERNTAVDQARGTSTLNAMWRNAQMKAEEAALAEKERTLETHALALAEQRRAEVAKALEQKQEQREAALHARERAVDEGQADLEARERNFDQAVERECEHRVEQATATWQARLAQRSSEVDGRASALRAGQSALEARKAGIRDAVAQEAQRLRGAREQQLLEGLYAVDGVLRRDHESYQQKLRRDVTTEEKRLADELRDREDELKAPLSGELNRISQLTTQGESLRKEITNWESTVNRSKAKAAELTARAQQIIASLEYERTQLANATGAAQNETLTLQNQVRTDRYELQNIHRSKQDVRNDMERVRREVAHLQGSIARLQNEIQNIRWKL